MVVSSPQYGEHTTFFSSFSVDELWLRHVSAGVFFIYGHVLLSSVPDALPRIRAPPLAAPYSGQMPEASPGAALAVMRDAHVLNSSPTRLKRTFH